MSPPRRCLLVLALAGCPWIGPAEHEENRQGVAIDLPGLTGLTQPEPSQTTPECEFPETEVPEDTPSLEAPFVPAWLGVDWQFTLAADRLHDLALDEDADGKLDPDAEVYPAMLSLALYDPSGVVVCGVYFDADAAVPSAGWPTTSGELYGAWTLDVTAGNTDCPPLDPAVYGTDDIRRLLADIPWGFGIGTLGAVGPALQAAVEADGESWAADWEPYVWGGFVTFDRVVASPIAYGIAYAAQCGDLGTDLVRLDVSGPSLPDGGWLGDAYYIRPFSDVTGISCVQAESDFAPSTFVPAAPEMVAPFVGFVMDVVPTPDGELADYWWDSDGDDVDEPFSSTVTVRVYDDALVQLCSFTYEADTAVEIDPGSWTSNTGEIWRAWQLELADGHSTDCLAVNEATFGTTDLRDVFAGWSFGFGIGEKVNIIEPLSEFYADTWAEVEPNVFSMYITLDGITASEVGYGIAYGLSDCLVRGPAQVPAPTAANWSTNVYGRPLFVTDLAVD